MRTVALVAHTHWDREWHESFQTLRLRLVDLLDAFLPQLEADPSFAHFMLDGQVALIDDYLEVRPEALDRLGRLGGAGRLSVGPWYVLMDEFLCSGETIVRNLQRGVERAAAFGGAMPVGYLPDMFGHVAQMPQLLRLAGFEHAVVWRGVPASVGGTAFRWHAPDGSSVRAEYLRHGYGNGAAVPRDAKALVRRIRAYEAELGATLGADAAILWMDGTDHQTPQPWLGRVVAEANDVQRDYRLAIMSLPAYLANAQDDGLPDVTGELRSGARANLLMGVASNRVDVKQAAAGVERELERRAEPLCALFVDSWPGALLELAWTAVIRNSAHDSVSACSIDEVVDAVLQRYRDAHDVARGVAGRALDALARSLASAGPVVVNISARARNGTVELELPGNAPTEGTQAIAVRPAAHRDRTLTAAEMHALLGEIRNQRYGDVYVNRIDVDGSDDALEVVVHTAAVLRPDIAVEEAKRELYARIGARPDGTVHVRVVSPASQRVVARVHDVPGYGWRRWSPAPLSVAPVSAEGSVMTNGLVTVEVDAGDGTFSLNGLAGLDRLVDAGDTGDTYNYAPPDDDVIVDRPTAVRIEVLETGPVRARLAVTRTFGWAEVRTVLELRAGEDMVRVHSSWVNATRDHRVRAVFPLPTPASVSRAECAFTVVERGLEAEGSDTEYGLPTFPSRRFVSAGGLTVVHEGLLEYELIEGGGALALTLLRATGWLSRPRTPYRTVAAGPAIETPGAQMPGPVEARYAIHVGDRNPYELVDDVFLALEVIAADGGGTRGDEGSALEVTGAEVSALRRVAGGALEVRLFNPTDVESYVALPGRKGWRVDLLGRPLEPFESGLPLAPHAIATLRLS